MVGNAIFCCYIATFVVCEAVSPWIRLCRRYKEEDELERVHVCSRLRLPPPPPHHAFYQLTHPYAIDHRYATSYHANDDIALEMQLHHERMRYQAELEELHRARRHLEEAAEDKRRRERDYLRPSTSGYSSRGGGRSGYREEMLRLQVHNRREEVGSSRGRQQSGRDKQRSGPQAAPQPHQPQQTGNVAVLAGPSFGQRNPTTTAVAIVSAQPSASGATMQGTMSTAASGTTTTNSPSYALQRPIMTPRQAPICSI